MSIPIAYIKLSIVMALTSVTLFASAASGQSPATTPNSSDTGIAAENAERDDLTEAVKEENAAVRELLRKMEEQQKTLLEQVLRLQRQLDAGLATDGPIAANPLAIPPFT